jgi:WD40-like Beta Propeller Repeat
MHSVLTWGQLRAATMLLATAVVMVPARVPLRALTTPCAGPAWDGTLLFTSQVPGAPGVTLFAADPARTGAPQALVRALPGDTVIAPSPRGRSIALAEGTRGLWLVNSDGTSLRRLLPAPPPSPGPTGTRYIHAVAWSPDRYTLAYAVVQPLGYPRYPAPPRAQPDGLWLVRYDKGAPRLLASNTQLAVDDISHLSFSADGRTLAVVASQGRGADNLAVDVATGRATPCCARSTTWTMSSSPRSRPAWRIEPPCTSPWPASRTPWRSMKGSTWPTHRAGTVRCSPGRPSRRRSRAWRGRPTAGLWPICGAADRTRCAMKYARSM